MGSCGSDREVGFAQHAEPPVVHPVGVRDYGRRSLRGPRLVVAHSGEEVIEHFEADDAVMALASAALPMWWGSPVPGQVNCTCEGVCDCTCTWQSEDVFARNCFHE